jgi:phosphatidylinositol alpha-mannosyltransferase
VLFLGRHEERKGLRVLLDAFAQLSGEPAPAGEGGAGGVGPLPVLWIAGNGPETEWLRRLHPESEHVRWLGVLTEEEKVRRLAAADVLCAPSLGGESFGMVLLEAMAARTLVVASDIDGYRDAVGPDAVLVPPGDPTSLAKALGAALDRPVQGTETAAARERKAFLDGASARAERWSMRRLAVRYEEIYRDVVVGGPS